MSHLFTKEQNLLTGTQLSISDFFFLNIFKAWLLLLYSEELIDVSQSVWLPVTIRVWGKEVYCQG